MIIKKGEIAFSSRLKEAKENLDKRRSRIRSQRLILYITQIRTRYSQ